MSSREGIGPREDADRRREWPRDVLCQGWAVCLAALFADTLPFTVQAVTEVIYSRFKRIDVSTQMADDPAIVAGLGQLCVAEHNAMNEFVIDLGKRDAEERVASLLLRLAQRLSSRSVFHGHRYPFPLRQQHIADMLGLTPVHVSRVMASLRRANVVEVTGRFLAILDWDKLNRIGRLN